MVTSSHPLSNVGLAITNFKCFGDEAGGFQEFQPINIIIGRNNTGKSALLDVINLCISNGKSYDAGKHARPNRTFTVEVTQELEEGSLRAVFAERTSGGGVPGGDHWNYGKQFIGQTLKRRFGPDWRPTSVEAPNFAAIQPASKQTYYEHLNKRAAWPFENLQLLKVSAERDVQPEGRDTTRTLFPNGSGTTNLVRAFINSDDLPRQEVEQWLLADLNVIYQGDCEFTQIICQENDKTNSWELYLREESKGDIRLSQSGSSLKSIFVILCILRLWPKIQSIDWKRAILAIEEPENNLHPALLRRLLDFLADQREQKGFTLILTTHSPISIDWSARRPDSQVIHVQHTAQAAKCRTAIGYRENREILDDLDIRASDLLQANGVIWVEGPSDRIYLRRWLDLASDGLLREGVDYTIMFYGGRLLSHLNALPPDVIDSRISLLTINRNTAVLIDSDRHPGVTGGKKPRMRLNETKRRIKAELEKLDGYVWVTEGREIENYTPIEVFARVVGKPAPKVNLYSQITKLPLLKDFREDKVSIAHAVAPNTSKADLVSHLDVWSRVNELCSRIRLWNGLPASE